MRQLAYVGEDGQIQVLDLDVKSETEIAPQPDADPAPNQHVIRNWPAWSPDGGRLAFFQYELVGDEVRRTSVRVAAADGSDGGEIYGMPNGAPIYMCWAPNGERLAVLVQESRDLYLRVVDRDARGPALTVAQGAPLYFTWQPDSRGLVVHTGGAGLASFQARVIWVRLEGGQATYASLTGTPAADFRAPAWSSRHGAATLAFHSDEGAEIALQGGPDGEPELLAAAGPGPAFIWNGDGERLAFASHSPELGGAYGPVSVFSAADRTTRQVSEGPCVAFFWCPDGRRIIYAGGDIGGRLMNLHCVDTVSGERRDLGWVRPSRDLMMLLGHFDQYSQSAHLFSPDGEEMVLAASLAQEQVNGSVPTVRQILVWSLSGDGVREVAARGSLAFWRPRG